jgi:nesprin-1
LANVKLFPQNTLLQETLEEWEQCLKKINSVDNYINSIKTTLARDDFYEKPLRDQLVAIEKMLADLNCQNTKIEISSQKLNVSFF